jgi:hypothetical protein
MDLHSEYFQEYLSVLCVLHKILTGSEQAVAVCPDDLHPKRMNSYISHECLCRKNYTNLILTLDLDSISHECLYCNSSNTESRGRVVITPASYSKGPG